MADVVQNVRREEVLVKLAQARSYDAKIDVCTDYLNRYPTDVLVRFYLGDGYCRKADSTPERDVRLLQKGLAELVMIPEKDDIYPQVKSYVSQLRRMIADDERVEVRDRINAYMQLKEDTDALIWASALEYKSGNVDSAVEVLSEFIQHDGKSDISLLVSQANKSLESFLTDYDALYKEYTDNSTKIFGEFILKSYFSDVHRNYDVVFVTAGLYAARENIDTNKLRMLLELTLFFQDTASKKLEQDILNDLESKKALVSSALVGQYTLSARKCCDRKTVTSMEKAKDIEKAKLFYNAVLVKEPDNLEAMIFKADYAFHKGVLGEFDATLCRDAIQNYIYIYNFSKLAEYHLKEKAARLMIDEGRMAALLLSAFLRFPSLKYGPERVEEIRTLMNRSVDLPLCEVFFKLNGINNNPNTTNVNLSTKRNREDYFGFDPLELKIDEDFENFYVGKKMKTIGGLIKREVKRLADISSQQAWWRKLWPKR